MKKIFTYIFLSIFCTSSFAQWEPLNPGVNINSFNDVFCISTNTIIAIGSQGTILKSTNGGDTWTKKISGTTETLVKVEFPTAEIGYIICSNGDLLKTTDSGETWIQKQRGDGPNYFSNLSCVDENIIFASNSKSTDGGENWTTFNETQNSDRIQFLNNDVGFVGEYLWKQNNSQAPKFFKTHNSGDSWQIISGVAPFHFLNENIGYYYLGGLYKTMNGGENFEKLSNNTNQLYSLRDLIAVGENTVWGIVYLSLLDGDTSSRGFIKISSSGNEPFTEQILPDNNPQLNFEAMHFANETLGFAVGRNNNQGIIWRNGNGINTNMATQEHSNIEFSIYPNPSSTQININFKTPIKENISVTLTDISGKMVYSEKFINKQTINIKTSHFQKGSYILSIQTFEKKSSQKIIIN